MGNHSIGLDAALGEYVRSHSSAPTSTQSALIQRTADLGRASAMQIAPEQGELLTTLTELVDPTLAVEIGTFTGYSALAIARGLSPHGRLLCCDVSEEWTSIARTHWAEAGLDDRIELRIGPAIDTVRALPADTPVDLAFIDADKTGYLDYYEELVPRLSPGGLICVDNTLWSGAVADPGRDDESTEALRVFNRHVADDDRTRQVIVPIGDGLTVIRHNRS